MNLKNRTIFCRDNIDILQGINSKCVDLIYIDPPFNKNKKFTAPIGTSAEGASFRDIFREEDVKEEWLVTIEEDHPELYIFLNGVKGVGNHYNFAYLSYMAIRLIECHRVLKSTGSVYLHCDPTMSHYLKILMDCVFGEKNFRNEIVWKRRQDTHNKASKTMGSVHDTILWYGDMGKSIYYKQFTSYDEDYIREKYTYSDNNGRYRILPCTNESGGNKPYSFKGVVRAWRFSIEKMEFKFKNDLLVQLRSGGPFYYKKYLKDAEGVPLQDIWNDIPPARGREKTGYPTQKPLALLERIIKASSKEGDVVLDPFCGCATGCIAAERLNRQWIGIDISIKAYELVKERLADEVNFGNILFKDLHTIPCFTSPPKRTDLEKDYREKKFVYVISNPKSPNLYKVGIAKNWKARLNSYQIGDPDRQYKVEFKIATPIFRETEKHIHQKFTYNLEWVQGDLQEIIDEIKNFNKKSKQTA